MPIDVNRIRADKGGDVETIRQSEEARYRGTKTVDDVIRADEVWRKAQFELEQTKKELGELQNAIKKKKVASKGQDKCEVEMEKKVALDNEITKKADEVNVCKDSRDRCLNVIGNIVHPSVPVSNDEANNAVVRTWGIPRSIQVDGKTPGRLYHHQVMDMLGALEQDPRGIKIAGHRGYFLKGAGVLLNMALINYGLGFLARKGYTPLQPPYFMKKSVMAETAQLDDFDEQLYKVSEYSEGQKKDTQTGDEGEYYLIATSEQPISAFHRKEWLTEEELPKKYAGVSTCFRKEAGSHGKETWGLYRIHQFEKVEQFCVTTPDNSWEMHEDMIAIAEEFYQSLSLPYRTVAIVSGALNDAAAKKYDLEAWFPGYNAYKELVSCSNCTDFQSRAMETRCGHVKQGDREKRFVHMLNSTLCATERCMCCIVENYQEKDGVRVPRPLVPYMNGLEFIPYVKKAPETESKKK